MKYMLKESGLDELISDRDEFLWLNPSIKYTVHSIFHNELNLEIK